MAKSQAFGRPARFWLSCAILLGLTASLFLAPRSGDAQAPTTIAQNVEITVAQDVDLRNAPPRGIFKWPGRVVSQGTSGQRFRVVELAQLRIPGGVQIWVKLQPVSTGGRVTWTQHKPCESSGGCWALWGPDPSKSAYFRKSR